MKESKGTKGITLKGAAVMMFGGGFIGAVLSIMGVSLGTNPVLFIMLDIPLVVMLYIVKDDIIEFFEGTHDNENNSNREI